MGGSNLIYIALIFLAPKFKVFDFHKQDEDRRSVLRSLNDDQYRDVIRVLALIPIIDVDVTTEVVDDEDAHVVTAGAIITVTVVLTRG